MKKIISILGTAVLFAMLACTPEAIEHPTEAGIASAAAYQPVITVDQTINQVTFSLPEGTTGVMPVWILQDSKGNWTQYSSVDGMQKIFAKSGVYPVRMKIMNNCGVSEDYVETSFTVDNTLVDFGKYYKFVAGSSVAEEAAVKEWRIDNSVEGHMACGDPGTDGTGRWSAKPDEKKDFGVYENRMRFGSDGSYTFDPGASGTVYVNIGCTKPEFTSQKDPDVNVDYCVPATVLNGEYKFDVVGEDVILILPAGMSWPYIPSDAFVDAPKFRLESISAKAMELVAELEGISWHFSLTSGEAEKPFEGYKYDAESNLWRPVDADKNYEFLMTFYAHTDSWEQYPEGSLTWEQNGSAWKFNLPYESNMQWQAQFHIAVPSLSVSADKNYDFSCVINSNKSFNGITVKLTDTEDKVALLDPRITVNEYEDYVLCLTDLKGVDIASAKFVLDFGGCPEGTEVTVRNIVLKDHAVDDGTVLPGNGGDESEDGAYYDITGATNLWRNSELGVVFWYANAGWEQIADPAYEWLDGDAKNFKLTMPEGIGGSEWQGQTHFTINTTMSSDKSYDFCATFNSTEETTITVKLAWEGNDTEHACFYENSVKLPAFEDFTFKMPEIKTDGVDYDKLALFIDFGRTPAGTVVTIKDVCFQEHQAPQAGGNIFDLAGDGNWWRKNDVSVVFWYANSGWGQIADPAYEWLDGDAKNFKVTMPEEIGGSEWQGQTHFTVNAPLASDKSFDFCATFNSTEETTITVKLAWEGHDTEHASFYENNVQLPAYEDFTFEKIDFKTDGTDFDKVALFVDFGRTPAGTVVTIKDVCLQEHK